MRVVVSVALVSALALAGCEKPAAPPPPSEGQAVEVAYACGAGKMLTATYPDARTAVVTFGGQTFTLTLAEAYSGKRYIGSGREWRMKSYPDYEEGVLSPSPTGAAAGGPPIATCRRAPSPGAAPAPAPVQPTPAVLSPCRSGDLTLRRVSLDAGAGQRNATYAISNNGPAACKLKGFVTAAWLDADGKPLDGVTVVQSETAMAGVGGPPAEVAIQPGRQAMFFASYTGIQATDKACTPAKRLRATPPGNTQAIEIDDDVAPCTDHITLGPVRADVGEERL